MTGLLGNRLSICPLRFRIASPRVPIDLGCASVNRNSWGGDPESLGPNRSAYYLRDQSLFTIGQAFSQAKRRKWQSDVTLFRLFSAFIRRMYYLSLSYNRK